MKQFLHGSGLLAVMLAAIFVNHDVRSRVVADEPFFAPYCKLPAWLDVTRCRGPVCADRYDKKCPPALPCPADRNCCDQYQAKCPPPLPCKTNLGCYDQYQRKCGPIRLPLRASCDPCCQ